MSSKMAWVLLPFVEMAAEEPSLQASECCDEFATTAALLATPATAVVLAAAAEPDAKRTETLSGSIEGFYSIVVPTYSPDTFRSRFRMMRSSFEVLCRQQWRRIQFASEGAQCAGGKFFVVPPPPTFLPQVVPEELLR